MTWRDLIAHRREQSGTAVEDGSRRRRFRRRVDRLFDDFFRSFETDYEPAPVGSSSLSSHGLRPCVDVSETPEAIEIEAELPGMSEDDIEVTVTEDVVRLRGVKRQPSDGERTYYLRERPFGAFYREVRLWTDVDQDAAEATFENGLLRIRLPKRRPSSKTKVIPVRAG